MAATAEIIDLRPRLPRRSQVDGAELTAYPDGSEVVNLFGPDASAFEMGGALPEYTEGFNENLAGNMTASQRARLADTLVEYWRVDLEARNNWHRLVDRAMVLLGVDKVDATQMPFPGAAAVQHPLIAEACTQFQANAIEEFFPATGPVKGALAGEGTDELIAQCDRASDYMNYYLTVEDPDYYADTDQMLFYLPIVGSVFRKAYPDPRDKMPKARYVKAEDFIAPYYARDLKNCSRYCHQYEMTGVEVRRAQANGEFLDIDLPRVDIPTEDRSSSSMVEKSDRMQRVLHEDDEVYRLLEYHVELQLPVGVDSYDDGDRELPYIITVDAENREILSIRRNWKERDPDKAKRIWFTHYKFLPGLGFYGWGFLHVIGSLADAVSGGIRAQLDSALFATMQGGFRAKDGAKAGGSWTIEPGKWKDIDASAEELAKTFYTPPRKEPSPALSQLITGLVQDGRRYASLTEVLVGQADNKAPVGTTLALIEQSMKLFTAIHKRIFAAAREEFRMLAELIYEHSPFDEYPYYVDGEAKQAFREDFDDRVDFLPVADPNIVSSVQRIALAQAQLELVNSSPELYGIEQKVEAHKRFLRALKIPEQDKVEPKIPTPHRVDPIGENALLLTGKSVKAFPGQHHAGHRMVHQHAREIAKNTMPAEQFQIFDANMQAHLREHDALEMMEAVSAQMQAQFGFPLPPPDLQLQAMEDMDPQTEMALTLAASQSLPPIPPPQPDSAAMGEGAVGTKGEDKAAEIQRQTEAKNAETLARIQRDTAAFVAKQEQQKIERDLALRHREEEHDQQMRHQDEAAAAEILRQNAKARAAQQFEIRRGANQLELERRRSQIRDSKPKGERGRRPKVKKATRGRG